jgi:hypothetical protein
MNQATTQHASSAAFSGSGSADAYNNDSNNMRPATHFESHHSMNSSNRHPYHQQQNFVSPTPRLIFHDESTSTTPPAMQSMHLETTHPKRTRDISAAETPSSSSTTTSTATLGILLPSSAPVAEQPPSLAKKSRNQYYIPPRQIPRSFVSQVGSLVVPKDTSASSGGIHISTHESNTNGSSVHPHRVGFRRQLSSSKIEALLSSVDHDSMDLDPETTRPRSMSF